MFLLTAGMAQSVWRLSRGWTVRGSNPIGGEIFLTRPGRPRGPPSFLYNKCWVSFPEVKRPRCGVDQRSPPSAEVENVYNYNCASFQCLLGMYRKLDTFSFICLYYSSFDLPSRAVNGLV